LIHAALATVYGIDVLISWNLKHLANLSRMRKINGVKLISILKNNRLFPEIFPGNLLPYDDSGLILSRDIQFGYTDGDLQ